MAEKERVVKRSGKVDCHPQLQILHTYTPTTTRTSTARGDAAARPGKKGELYLPIELNCYIEGSVINREDFISQQVKCK